MEEIRKDISGYEGLYIISSLGVIKSLSKRSGLGRTKIREKELKQIKGSTGYYGVILCSNGKIKKKSVHRLIAAAFISNPDNKPCINHKDGDKLNNKIENLEWCTYKENTIHKYRVLLFRPVHLGKFGKSHPTSRAVNQYTLDGKFIRKWDCMINVQKELGRGYSNICQCCKGKLKTSMGFVWEYT